MNSWDFLKSALFQYDAEKVHEVMVDGLCRIGTLSPYLLDLVSGSKVLKKTKHFISFAGKKLYSPVGLAAGFDKNALLIPYLPHLGFSFAEIGSVTLRAQSGNPKPRLFRGDDLLFNRMGFNNDGAEVIAKRMSQYEVPDSFVLGVNIGLNKDSSHEVAADEYLQTFQMLYEYGDYFVVNVSSPNTPGLRDLQSVSNIEKIFSSLKKYKSKKSVFLKLAPELDEETKNTFFEKAQDIGIDGFVLTNTLKGERESLVGGWSGKCLTEISREALRHAKLKSKLPIISVGGIMSVDEALRRKELGADLVQIYTGWIFRGPRFPEDIRQAWFREKLQGVS